MPCLENRQVCLFVVIENAVQPGMLRQRTEHCSTDNKWVRFIRRPDVGPFQAPTSAAFWNCGRHGVVGAVSVTVAVVVGASAVACPIVDGATVVGVPVAGATSTVVDASVAGTSVIGASVAGLTVVGSTNAQRAWCTSLMCTWYNLRQLGHVDTHPHVARGSGIVLRPHRLGCEALKWNAEHLLFARQARRHAVKESALPGPTGAAVPVPCAVLPSMKPVTGKSKKDCALVGHPASTPEALVVVAAIPDVVTMGGPVDAVGSLYFSYATLPMCTWVAFFRLPESAPVILRGDSRQVLPGW